MSTFHPFPRLPLELRYQIWEMTVEPRTVDVRRPCRWPEQLGHLITSTPIPATLHSCKEARNHGLYRKVFFELEGQEEQEGSTEQRYVWLNLDIDLVDIGTSYFKHYEHIASSIKRLKFERENTDEYFYHTESQQLGIFSNAEEIHVVCADGFWSWGGAIEEGTHPWPCNIENLIFTEKDNDQVARGLELERICQEIMDLPTGETSSDSDES